MKLLGLPMEFPDLEMLVPSMRLRVARDLKCKGCDPKQLHTALQEALRGANEHDKVVRWSQWHEAAHSSSMALHATALRDRLGVTTRKVEAEILKSRG